jgi:hypothetical protein
MHVVSVDTNLENAEVATRRNVVEALRKRILDSNKTVPSVLRTEDDVVAYVHLRVVERFVFFTHTWNIFLIMAYL